MCDECYLFPRMYTVAPQHGGRPRRDPDAGECVGIHFILLYKPLTLFMYVDATMLSVVDLIVPDYGITVCTYL